MLDFVQVLLKPLPQVWIFLFILSSNKEFSQAPGHGAVP